MDIDKLDVQAPRSWKWEKGDGGGMSLWTGEGRPFRLDYSRLKPLLRRQPLAKAIGLKAGGSLKKPLFVLDVMAGWGREAFLLASLGCKVEAVEAHPLVFAFAQSALSLRANRAARTKNGKSAAALSLKFFLGDSLSYMKAIKPGEEPDVIYMDPMFCESKKSLSAKPLRILKALADEEAARRGREPKPGPAGARALLCEALKKARKRVAVKRHRLQPPVLLQPRPLCSFSGRSVRFDVYRPAHFA